MSKPDKILLNAAKEAKALIDEMFSVDLILEDTPIAERASIVQSLLAASISQSTH